MVLSLLAIVDKKGRILDDNITIPVELDAKLVYVCTDYTYTAPDHVPTIETNLNEWIKLDDIAKMDEGSYLVGGIATLEKYIVFLGKITVVVMHDRMADEKAPSFHHILYNKRIDSFDSFASDKTNIDVLRYVNHFDLHPERTYLQMLEKVHNNGQLREDRTGTGTLSVFGHQVRFDISKNIPILTTKFVPWRMVVEELLWFMRGDTDSKILEAKNVNIWKGNTSREFLDSRGLSHLPEGDIGCGYGFQWRHFGGEYIDCHSKYDASVGFDQLQNIIDTLRTDPFSRRVLMTAWNAKDLDKMALPPCHNQVQFYVTVGEDGTKHLSCHMYQRSVDTFLGFPWNILSYSVMTYILAMKTGMQPKELIISTGDTHIYKNHIMQVESQLERKPLPWPMMMLSSSIKDKPIEEITIDDFKVTGYFHHPSITASMAV